MASDRFVYWTDRRPTVEEVERVLRNTVGYAGCVDRKGGERAPAGEMPWFVVTLAGKPTLALDGIADVAAQVRGDMPTERWFEVVVHGDKCVDVLTRMQDEFTNAIARSVAETLKRYWGGADEPPADKRSA